METIIKQEWLINPNITSENHRDISKCLQLGLKYPSNLLADGEDVEFKTYFYAPFEGYNVPYILKIRDKEKVFPLYEMRGGEMYVGEANVEYKEVNITILLIPKGDDYNALLEEVKEFVLEQNYITGNVLEEAEIYAV